MDYLSRKKKLLKNLKAKSLDALLVRKKENIFYLTGVKGDDAVLFVSHKKSFLVTDSRYKEEYARSLNRCTLRISDDTGLYAAVGRIAKETRSDRIGFESNAFLYSEYAALKKELRNKKLVAIKGEIERMRVVKDADEIDCVKKACVSGIKVMDYAVKTARPSIREKDLKNMIEAYMAKEGISKAGFDIIVASGKNASMPHAVSSGKIIKKGEMVIIDLGTIDYGYSSDLTRTVFLGRINREYLRVYNIVLDAQKKTIESIKPGIAAKYIDNISRQYISEKGFGKYFIHSLGHGLGLETHEDPRVSKKSSDILAPNMIITVEPGIYIPGWGGVRLEDVVLVTKNGCKVLTERCKK